MPRYGPTSLQSSNSISQAQDAAESAHSAVTKAQSHPAEQLIEEAYNSLDTAENALQQALKVPNQEPVERVKEQLQEDRANLQNIASDEPQ
ncbi:hypothetical protein [Paenibacillus contaminans]|uniref:DUF3813 domain-containing protein n=1 Tax=Paenibacillus contaminans TaxID=450362 RepID=A0A329MPS7_9BACL|nr:hypothetical protein [Paenibacillus contaminans]RAV21929.1 hypothetical protein DQG23_07735 [Paenibacillus contaminans]